MPSHLRVAHGGQQNQRSMGVCQLHLPGSCPSQGCLCNCGHRLYTLFKTLDPGAVIASENMLAGTPALKLEKNFSRRNPYTYESILILSYLALFNGFWERIFILFVIQSFVKNWRYLFLNSRKAFLSPQKMITAAGWSKGRGLEGAVKVLLELSLRCPRTSVACLQANPSSKHPQLPEMGFYPKYGNRGSQPFRTASSKLSLGYAVSNQESGSLVGEREVGCVKAMERLSENKYSPGTCCKGHTWG